ncbi:PhzF family phenazine biosynthesis protein [Oscillatoria salina]|uniref:PhzF family phenazine biosynthesis protein n=1 Tax=Oscillatoria salina TaxID=331517 RepID=UPI001CCD4D57|nr:PhzF family phenazine biosynthesis protein [Oscillatoria salina]MBZ8181945.1 PhzF family phenazine biosynthesis protein [Oscillatoria salina IIICB1]
MTSLTFYIVDVFAQKKYTGNQLAVFVDAEKISDEEMQKIAQEINYSETTFILSKQLQNNGYNVRIFTPQKELPFAGHPTLGTAYILQTKIAENSPIKVNLNLKVGQIPVTFQSEFVWMRQNSPTFNNCFEINPVAAALNLKPDDIDSRFPVQAVSTGIPFIIVPLKSLAAVKKARLNKELYLKLVKDSEAKELLIFAPETYAAENDLNVRVFAELLGIPEDPATGSANGCLAGYLVKYTYFGQKEINLKVEQGYEINRPSLLLLKAQENNAKIEVNVGGKVVMVAQGNWM